MSWLRCILEIYHLCTTAKNVAQLIEENLCVLYQICPALYKLHQNAMSREFKEICVSTKPLGISLQINLLTHLALY